MKSFLIFLMFAANSNLAMADVCSTTIKCKFGTATCSLPDRQPTDGMCGKTFATYRACMTVDGYGDLLDHRYLCCSKDGEALLLTTPVLVQRFCADAGLVQ